MGSDGTIVEQGNFEQLNSQDGYVQSLLLEEEKQKGPILIDYENSDPPAKSVAAATNDDGAEDLLRAMGDTKLYTYYFKSIGWKYGCILFLFVSLWAFFEFFPRKPPCFLSESNLAYKFTQRLY
jgi:ATP-binding cassette subfamily C (CFTR/MRP) protein 1